MAARCCQVNVTKRNKIMNKFANEMWQNEVVAELVSAGYAARAASVPDDEFSVEYSTDRGSSWERVNGSPHFIRLVRFTSH
jgi:hypothetical protein